MPKGNIYILPKLYLHSLCTHSDNFYTNKPVSVLSLIFVVFKTLYYLRYYII